MFPKKLTLIKIILNKKFQKIQFSTRDLHKERVRAFLILLESFRDSFALVSCQSLGTKSEVLYQFQLLAPKQAAINELVIYSHDYPN